MEQPSKGLAYPIIQRKSDGIARSLAYPTIQKKKMGQPPKGWDTEKSSLSYHPKEEDGAASERVSITHNPKSRRNVRWDSQKCSISHHLKEEGGAASERVSISHNLKIMARSQVG
ncbi:hypothetical protein LIER_06814 [Lithospermum erythrorhizon]|uniref:Uncharacterized protein n=1 Tax=Lithospermum erythrorhizon TaxID=34254 RepID=A0AAV3P5S0_LITER